jgi:hypothetical protein
MAGQRVLGADLNCFEVLLVLPSGREAESVTRVLSHESNHLTIGPQTMAVVMGAKRGGRSVVLRHHSGHPTNLQKPPD